jgi:hypothetical protein
MQPAVYELGKISHTLFQASFNSDIFSRNVLFEGLEIFFSLMLSLKD